MIRMSKSKIIGGMIIALLLLGLIPFPALAQEGSGIGFGPAIIKINDAFRGAEYENSLYIRNMGAEKTDYSITVEGEASSWLSFYVENSSVKQISVPAYGEVSFTMKISVPQDAQNQEYTVTITATSIPGPSSAGQAIALAARTEVDIQVSGTQVISGTVTGISTNDVEVGYPLKIQMFMQNTGNVEVSPLLKANITQNGQNVDSITQNNTKVKASQGDFIYMEWDTTGRAPGDYEADVVVNLDGKDIASENLKFKILPLGTLTRSGELKDISINGAVLVNFMTKVQATFVNTGQIDTWAEFSGELYLKGNLIDVFTGEKLLIERGKEGTLVAYFKPEKTGSYVIKGQVTYEGKKTEVKELTFNVITPTTAKKSSGLLYVVIGVGAFVVLGGVGVIIWQRKRS